MRLLLAAAILLSSSAGAAQAHEELGAWCWSGPDASENLRVVYTVTRSDEGQYFVTETSGEAEGVQLPLLPVGVNEYAIKGEHSVGGIILRADGMLELYNSQGSIGAASPCDTTND